MPDLWRSTSTTVRLGAAVALIAAAAFGARELSRDALAPPTIVSDAAGLIEPAERAAIEDQHAFLRSDHGVDYRVETVRGVGDLDRYAVQRFGALAIGDAGRGLLLVIDAEADQVRLEVGRALEGVFPDGFVAYVEQRQMVPFFAARRVGDGVLAATELLVGQVQREQARGGFAALPISGSGGGGARTRARIGAAKLADRIGETPAPAVPGGNGVAAGDTPEATVAHYLAAMRARNADPSLDLYTSETRAMLARWVMTPAQMDTLVRTYRDCRADPVRLDTAGTRAVLCHPVAQRGCAPWFLVRADGRWRLDLATASSVIRFGRDNSWHFVPGAEHPYAFAFHDGRFDRSGFPKG